MKKLLIIAGVLLLPAIAHAQTSSVIAGRGNALTPGQAAIWAPSSTPVGTLASSGLPAETSTNLKASTQTSAASETAPASTSAFTMQGVAGAVTPTVTGRVLINAQATVTSSSGAAGVGIICRIYYGTGAAPANGAALTGTAVGQPLETMNGTTLTAADIAVPFYLAGTAALTVGTVYWVDLACEAVGTVSVMGLSNINLTVTEN